MIILTGVRWNLNVTICISFKARDVEHFFMYLLGIWTSSFESCLFNSSVYLLIGLFNLLLFNLRAVYILWILILSLVNKLQGFFSHSVDCLFILVIVSFGVQRLFIWCNPICQFLLLFLEQFLSYLESCCLYLCLQEFSPYLLAVISKFQVLH
jgi:hypothetical protein